MSNLVRTESEVETESISDQLIVAHTHDEIITEVPAFFIHDEIITEVPAFVFNNIDFSALEIQTRAVLLGSNLRQAAKIFNFGYSGGMSWKQLYNRIKR
jgi:hypothetical protein